jgi:NitT/TauT family transport system permease protein
MLNSRQIPPPAHATETGRDLPAIRAVGKITRLFSFRCELPFPLKIGLGLAAWLCFLALWQWLAAGNPSPLVPTPAQVGASLYDLFINRGFSADVIQSVRRILISFIIAISIALPIGISMGTFPPVESFFNALVSPFRYLPAPSFVPLLLMWLGTGDSQKIALLILGVVFFLITLFMDNTRSVDSGLVECARTLGAKRSNLLLKVIFPSALPNYLNTARQMLAVSWTYLVIAEIVAATDGIGAMMMRAKRFVRVDDIMAGILVIGLLGLCFDLAFRLIHRGVFRYLR